MSEKLMSLDKLEGFVRGKKEKGQTVALCHGCFDILHWGHLLHFRSARSVSDVLVVTLTKDEFVSKGPNRPIFTAQERATLVAGIEVVDAVAINNWPSAIETIAKLRPSVFVKGAEYEPSEQQINSNFALERDAIEAVGGKMIFTRDQTSSSTMAVNKLYNNE